MLENQAVPSNVADWSRTRVDRFRISDMLAASIGIDAFFLERWFHITGFY